MARIENPTSSENIGLFNNIAYTRYKGRFAGTTAPSDPNDAARVAFSVPYEITTPTNPAEGNRTFVVEPPHFSGGSVARDVYLGPGFFWKRGFSHISVGYSNVNRRILNHNPGFPLKIQDKDITELLPAPEDPPNPREITDYNIFRQLALTLKQSPPPFLGAVQRIYSIGFSDSGNTVNRIYGLFGREHFDISFPCTSQFFTPVPGAGRIIVFNTEADFDVRTVPSTSFPNCRWYAVSGGPHIPDTSCTRMYFHGGLANFNPAPPVEGTTPLDWVPFIKALFVAGDAWVREGRQPPPSVVLKVNPGGLFARDVRGNALGGIRHPALELKEATFIASVVRVRLTEPPGNARGWGNFGAYSRPTPISAYPNYKEVFKSFTDGVFRARFLLKEDRDILIQRAELPPPPNREQGTYTINYMRKQFPSQTPTADECGATSPVTSREQDFSDF